jgi:hypothetical protein
LIGACAVINHRSADFLLSKFPPPTELPFLPLRYIDVQNLNIFLRLLLMSPRILNLVNHIETLCRSPENSVFAIKPGLCDEY